MFESPPKLSSDLEWMLQSGQATRRMLAEALIGDYYTRVHRLSLFILKDQEAASEATAQTFVAALLGVHRYRSTRGVQIWLYTLTLEICKKNSKMMGAKGGFLERPFRANTEDNHLNKPVIETEALFWQTMDHMPENERLMMGLRYLEGLPSIDIARIMKRKESRVRAELIAVQDNLLKEARLTADNAVLADIDWQGSLADSLNRRWPLPALSESEIERLVLAILEKASQRGARLRFYLHFKELGLTGATIALVLVLGFGINLLFPLSGSGAGAAIQKSSTPSPILREAAVYYVHQGESLDALASRLGVPVSALTDFRGQPPGEQIAAEQELLVQLDELDWSSIPQKKPGRIPRVGQLSKSSDADSIRQRMEQSAPMWRSLWLDIQRIEYGPASYIGPPKISRTQVWVQQPGLSLEVYGEQNRLPDGITLTHGDYLFHWYIGSDMATIDLRSGEQLIRSSWAHAVVFTADAPWLKKPGTIKILGREKVANRQALVVDWLNNEGNREARLWLDTRTGIILRQQEYGGSDYQKVIEEIVVSEIDVNEDIPSELFDPHRSWKGGFASNSRAETIALTEDQPEPTLPISLTIRSSLPYLPAPTGFDPSASRLEFQSLQAGETSERSVTKSMAPMAIYADGYLLGQVDFGHPWYVTCIRSADGKRVAVLGVVLGSLRWFNLTDLANVYRPMPHLFVSDMAFSPDSRRLAVFGVAPDSSRGIYLLDLGTGEQERIFDLLNANSLVWSPDGRYLAMIGREQEADSSPEVLVLNVSTRQVTYRASYEASNEPSSDWPTLAWGVEFPAQPRQMYACAEPPK